ncbi:hypothetical protein POM88_034135 [Heracleum sosnowskyi]|uniref:Branched-chain-amino-acid transaminase n=1 Tax=Heracleum sosnowskyi TaxID=360622 RepID=A0AAD8MDB2_9APIA|nr:hypothetical protein POM88_034135 [Heracleum sosnowskyi]
MTGDQVLPRDCSYAKYLVCSTFDNDSIQSIASLENALTQGNMIASSESHPAFGANVFVMKPFDQFMLYHSRPRIVHQLYGIASLNGKIWDADCNSNDSRALIGKFKEKIALCGLQNGAIVSVDLRLRPQARLTRKSIILQSHRTGKSKSSSEDSARRGFELRGSIYPSGTTSTTSSISRLTSLKQYDQYFLASSMDGSTKLYDHRMVQRGAVLSYQGNVGLHYAIRHAVDPWENHVMSGGQDGKVRLWSVKSGELLFEEMFMGSMPLQYCWGKKEVHLDTVVTFGKGLSYIMYKRRTKITQFLESQGFLDYLERGLGSDESNNNLLDKLQDAIGRGQNPFSILPSDLEEPEIITISDSGVGILGSGAKYCYDRFPSNNRTEEQEEKRKQILAAASGALDSGKILSSSPSVLSASKDSKAESLSPRERAAERERMVLDIQVKLQCTLIEGLVYKSIIPGKGSLYIRPLLMGSGSVLTLAPAPEFTFLIYVSPVGNYFKDGLSPIDLMVETETHRATPGGTGCVKTIGNYAAVLKAQSSAKAKGYSDVLYLDHSCAVFYLFHGAAGFKNHLD